MAVAKMKLVSIVGPINRFDDVVRSCIVGRGFNPENVMGFLPGARGLMLFADINPSGALLNKACMICEKLGISPSYREFPCKEPDYEEISAFFDSLLERHEKFCAEKKELLRLAGEDRQIVLQLDKMKEVHASLDDLFTLKYSRMRFGRIPTDIYENFSHYIESNPDLFFFVTGQSGGYVYGMYITTAAKHGRIDAMFSSLHFERILISSRAHGTPLQSMQALQEELVAMNARLFEIDALCDSLRSEEGERFLGYYSALKYYSDTHELRRFAAHSHDTFYLCGWVPDEELLSFKSGLENYSELVCLIEEPQTLAGISPPTKLKNKGPVKYFESFVSMYGLPSYNESDPTLLLAVSYTLFFGVMFGDIGQGLLLIAAGLLAYRFLKMPLGRAVSVIGCSSVFFGFVYGSVFGNEDLIPGFKAFESARNTNIMLLGAMALGFLFISLAMVFNIANGIRQKDLSRALFSQNGIAGFIFYWALAGGALGTIFFGIRLFSPAYIALLILLPLVLIFFQGPLGRLAAGKKDWLPSKMGEYIAESTFELFEILLSFLANSISFVRIGAFALNHIGMMLVVFALAGSVGRAAGIFVFIAGNLVVICLEGLIVGIQVLRLEFYELFGRFYTGGGRDYRPFVIDYVNNKS